MREAVCKSQSVAGVSTMALPTQPGSMGASWVSAMVSPGGLWL